MKDNKEYIEVPLESGTFYTERMVGKYSNRGGWEPNNPKHITSFIPGTIIEIKVNVGESVCEGDVLMLFGAMKMDNIISSPMSATIKSINVSVGESVPKGCVMIELE